MSADLLPQKRPATLRTASAVATMLIDTEEDFDWACPVEGTSQSTAYLSHIADLQHVLAAYGIQPTYLVTYPVLMDASIVRILQRGIERRQCAVGLQLHPWVTPPLVGTSTSRMSFAGNLALEIEERKLATLIARFINCFGMPPRIFRAGRYGISNNTAHLLEIYGFTVDTSVAPRTSMVHEGGPDYSEDDFAPFWFGTERDLLELPLCRSVVGWGGPAGAALYRILTRSEAPRRTLAALLAGSECAERITLSPEGNDVRAMRRLIRRLRARGQGIFPVSFHSSSLWPGLAPYVRSRADLHWFYDRLSVMLSYLADDIACEFVTAGDIPAMLAPPPPRLREMPSVLLEQPAL